MQPHRFPRLAAKARIIAPSGIVVHAIANALKKSPAQKHTHRQLFLTILTTETSVEKSFVFNARKCAKIGRPTNL